MEDKLKFLEQEANELYKRIQDPINAEEVINKMMDLIEEANKVVGEIKIEEWKSLNQQK